VVSEDVEREQERRYRAELGIRVVFPYLPGSLRWQTNHRYPLWWPGRNCEDGVRLLVPVYVKAKADAILRLGCCGRTPADGRCRTARP
jgi:hypothetical protein